MLNRPFGFPKNSSINPAKSDRGTGSNNWNPRPDTGTIDNVDTSQGNYIVFNSAGVTITGFSGGVDGRIIWVMNVGSGYITFTNFQTGSNSQLANRIQTAPGAVYQFQPNVPVMLVYDGGNQRWRVLSLVSATAAPLAVGTASAGSNYSFSDSAHIHPTGAGTPTTQAYGDAAATGSGPAAAMTDHKHAMMAATGSGMTATDLTTPTSINATGDTTGGVTLGSQTAAASTEWIIRAFGLYTIANSATARTCNVTPYWGSTALPTVGINVKTSVAFTAPFFLEYTLIGVDTTHISCSGMMIDSITDGTAGNVRLHNTAITSTLVTSGLQTIDLKFKMSTTVPGDAWSIESVFIQRVL
jgi:hypothetical protein